MKRAFKIFVYCVGFLLMGTLCYNVFMGLWEATTIQSFWGLLSMIFSIICIFVGCDAIIEEFEKCEKDK